LNHDEIFRQMVIGYRAKVEDSMVPIVIEKGSGPESIGTGTLFQDGEDRYIITAYHVVEILKETGNRGKCGIPVGKFNADVYNFGNCIYFTPNKNFELLDIGLILLSDVHVRAIERNYSFISSHDVAPYRNDLSSLVIGFPTSSQITDRDELKSRTFSILTNDDPDIESLEYKFVNPATIKLQLNKTLYSDGNLYKTITVPDLHGISGCGIWNIYGEFSGRIWAPHVDIKFAGVQHHVSKTNSYIVGLKSEVFQEALRKAKEKKIYSS